MSIATKNKFLAKKIFFKEDRIFFMLKNNDVFSLPVSTYPLLKKATPKKREKFTFIGNGEGIFFPKIDEHISIEISYQLSLKEKSDLLKNIMAVNKAAQALLISTKEKNILQNIKKAELALLKRVGKA